MKINKSLFITKLERFVDIFTHILVGMVFGLPLGYAVKFKPPSTSNEWGVDYFISFFVLSLMAALVYFTLDDSGLVLDKLFGLLKRKKTQ